MVDWSLAEARLQPRDMSAHSNSGRLGCPCCRQRYRFGALCPSCDVALVEPELMDVVDPVRAPERPPWLLASWSVFRIMAPAGLAALGLMSWLVNHGILSLPAP